MRLRASSENFCKIAFDDIPYLKIAQQEHDAFAQVLRDNGVEWYTT